MKKYEFLGHRADLQVRAFGKTRKDLFLHSMEGMIKGMGSKIVEPQKQSKRKVKVESLDLPALLVDFLSEVLYLTQVHKEIYSEIRFIKFTDKELEVELTGYEVERFGEDIKAVTHHNVDVHQREDGTWEATVLFDV
jgi:SHS2 domain-containing protein